MSALDRPLWVTFFRNPAAAVKEESPWTCRELAQHIHATTAPTKEDLPWLKLARFGNARSAKGSLRHDANVRAITGVEGDYDTMRVSFDEAEERLVRQGVAAILYTSPRYTEDSPRWRVLCPLSQETPPDRRDAMLGRLNGLFGGIFSRESWALSQSYYFGSVASNPSHRVELIEGTPIDEHDELDEIWIGPANAQKGSATDRQGAKDEREIAELVRRILTAEEFHTCLTPLAARLVGQNVPSGTVAAILRGIMLAHPETSRGERWTARFEEIDRLVESAVAKYGTAAAERREATRVLAKIGCRLVRQRVPELEIVRQLRAENSSRDHPLSADDVGRLAIWAARMAGGPHAAGR